MPTSQPRHTPARASGLIQHDAYDHARGNSHERGYDRDWRRLRLWYLRQHPLCIDCGAAASEAHHIETVEDRPERRLDQTNLAALCHVCHMRRHAKADRST